MRIERRTYAEGDEDVMGSTRRAEADLPLIPTQEYRPADYFMFQVPPRNTGM